MIKIKGLHSEYNKKCSIFSYFTLFSISFIHSNSQPFLSSTLFMIFSSFFLCLSLSLSTKVIDWYEGSMLITSAHYNSLANLREIWILTFLSFSFMWWTNRWMDRYLVYYSMNYEVPWISFKTFFVQAFRIVVDSWKFSMLLLYILWDDWPIFMISGSNEQLQQDWNTPY